MISWGKSCHLLKKGFSNFIDGYDDSMKDDDIVDDIIDVILLMMLYTQCMSAMYFTCITQSSQKLYGRHPCYLGCLQKRTLNIRGVR